jgi:glycosyltransferase involved in cell wall biosynthesis
MSIIKPKVSVLLPVYQGERYLREAINSILNQTFTDFEFIIIDDASTDRSAEIIRSYPDARIRFMQNQTNLGLIATLNKGLEAACGEYIARMDQDDVSLPERLSKQVAFMNSREDLAASGTWSRDIDDEGKVIGNRCLGFGKQLLYGYWWPCPIIHPSAIIRRSLLGNLRYDAEAMYCEDYDFWLRLREKHPIDNLPEYLVLYRVHSKSMSIKHSEKQLRSVHRVLCRRTGLKISYEEFLELLGETRRRNPIPRILLRRRLARAIRKPYGRYLAEEMRFARDWLRAALKLDAIKPSVIQFLYRIWLRIKPYVKSTPKRQGF